MAEAGRDNVTFQDPYYFENVHSVKVLMDETKRDTDHYRAPILAGYLGLTVIFLEEDYPYAEIPLTMWFRLKTEKDDKHVSIPPDLVKEIQKLPPWKKDDSDSNVRDSNDVGPDGEPSYRWKHRF